LQTGVCDGEENTPTNIWTQKMHEVQRNMTISNHGYIGYIVVAAKPFWVGLPADIRSALQQAIAEATVFTNELAERENVQAVELIRATGKTTIIQLTPDEQEAWRKAMFPVYAEMAPRVGSDLIAAIQKTVGSAS
jgi:C4-dicarboxylate-binding protein DctP